MDVILGAFVAISLWQAIVQLSALAKSKVDVKHKTLLTRIFVSFFRWLESDEEAEQNEQIKDVLVLCVCFKDYFVSLSKCLNIV